MTEKILFRYEILHLMEMRSHLMTLFLIIIISGHSTKESSDVINIHPANDVLNVPPVNGTMEMDGVEWIL